MIQKNGEVPSTTLVMTISYDQVTGQVQVAGPINNEMVSLWMLEKAKDAVKLFTAQQAADNRIVPATALPRPA
jgi:hypothetical protein